MSIPKTDETIVDKLNVTLEVEIYNGRNKYTSEIMRSVLIELDANSGSTNGQTLVNGSTIEGWGGSRWLVGFIPTWTTCTRHNANRLTGPNILLVKVVLVGGTFLALGTMHEKTSCETADSTIS